MITSRFEWIWEGSENAVSLVDDRRRFPVHNPVRPDYFTPEDMSNALVPKTDPEDRGTRPKLQNQIVADTGIERSSRSWGDTNPVGMHLRYLIQSYLIVSFDDQIRAKLTKILDQVVGKRIVVVDDEHHIMAFSLFITPNKAIAFFAKFFD